MQIELTIKEIQVILDVLTNETYHVAVTARENIWRQVKQSSRPARTAQESIEAGIAYSQSLGY